MYFEESIFNVDTSIRYKHHENKILYESNKICLILNVISGKIAENSEFYIFRQLFQSILINRNILSQIEHYNTGYISDELDNTDHIVDINSFVFTENSIYIHLYENDYFLLLKSDSVSTNKNLYLEILCHLLNWCKEEYLLGHCIFCNRKTSTYFNNCGHSCFCSSCRALCNFCPICKEEVFEIVYL